MTIRRYVRSDAEVLAEVYRDSVRTIGPEFYTPRQVEMWAKYPEDIEEFRNRMSGGLTLLAIDGDKIVGFGQLDPDDHLAFLYCLGLYCRRGVGTMIYAELEIHAYKKKIAELHTEASRISRSFFLKQGYRITEIEQVIRFGVEFERFRMAKKIQPNQALEPTALGVTAAADAPAAPPSAAAHL